MIKKKKQTNKKQILKLAFKIRALVFENQTNVGVTVFVVGNGYGDPSSNLVQSAGAVVYLLHHCRGVRPPTMSVQDMTLNNLIVIFQ